MPDRNSPARRPLPALRPLALLAAGAVFFAAGAGLGRWAPELLPALPQATAENPPDTYRVMPGTITRSVAALGLIEPRVFVDVGSQVSGQLRRVDVAIGDRVAKGDQLAEIDPRIYETRVTGDEAKLRNLKAQADQARAERDLARLRDARIRRLVAANAASREDADTSAANLRIAEARVEAIEAQIGEAQSTLDGDRTNLSYTRILAPIDGTVVSQTSVVGQTLNASQTSPIILRLADLATMTVRAQVAEADVVRLRPGQTARFSTLGQPERLWESRIRQILPTPQTINDVVLYDVLIDIDNSDGALMTSMTAQVSFVFDEATNLPVVPLQAVAATPDGGHEVRILTAGGGVERRRVTLGLADRRRAAVTAGLAVGETVILPEEDHAGARGA
ncbi:efflux RND transporter periplasmic adaptor subunit [Tistrella mobilis]|uniref:efflux RND transporter periplasmic adaptor subunit n=1 Tax=Tistrella mobilis TaxID=171437 RepID=UPI0031F609E4